MSSPEEIARQIKQHPRLVIADDFEIAIERGICQTKSFQNGVECHSRQEENLWISLRLIHRKVPGRSATTSCNAENLTELVVSAFDSAAKASVDPWFRFPLWKNQKESVESELDETFPESAFSRLKRLPESVEETLEARESSLLLHRKSEKFQLKRTKRSFATSFSVLSGEGFRLSERRSFSRPLPANQWLEGLVDQSFELSRAVPFSGDMGSSLLISAQSASKLLRIVAGWFCADQMQSGASLLSRLGNADPLVFSKCLNIMDDGKYPGGLNSSPFDMEGSPSQATLLVEDGELGDLLYDTYTATRENRLSTGNFIAPDGASFPRPHPTNFFILPGTASRMDLVGAVKRGLFLQRIDAIENVYGSERECIVRGSGWLVSSGACTQPVHSVTLRLDLLSLLERVEVIGNDLAFFGGYGSPSLLVSGKL